MLTVRGSAASLTAASAAYGAARSMDRSIERLSTGNRINAARDDAAGVAIGSRIQSSIFGLQQGIRNALDCQSLLNVAESGLSDINNALQRLRELSLQAANDTNSIEDRKLLQVEANSIVCHIDDIANSTNWAGQKLLDGIFIDKQFLIGGAENEADMINISINSATAYSLGLRPEQVDTIENEVTLSADTSTSVNQVNMNLEQSLEVFANTQNSHTNFAWSSITTTSATSATGSVYDNTYVITSNQRISTAENSGWHYFPQEFQISSGIAALSTSAKQQYNILFERPTKNIFIAFESIGQTNLPISIQFNFDVNLVWSLETQGSLIEKSNDRTIIGQEGYTIVRVPDSMNSIQINFNRAEFHTRTYIGAEEFIIDPDDDFGENPAPDDSSTDNVGNFDDSCGVSNIDFSSSKSSISSLEIIDSALSSISTQRSALGAMVNRIDFAISHNTSVNLKLSASFGRIVDIDFALEVGHNIKNNVIHQASTSMIAQANSSKKNILDLIKNSSVSETDR